MVESVTRGYYSRLTRPPIRSINLPAMSIRLRTKSDLKAVFQEYNIWARKELGQNFLIDHNLLRFLVESGEVGENDFLLDIGAGTGLLTRKLAQRAWKVWAVEIDARMFDFCSAYTSGLTNIRMVNRDVLKNKYNLDPELEAEILAELQSRPETRFKVVSNLPYSISTLIIPILLQGPIPVERMVLTVQKEVGERLVAEPGTKDYGSLSVIIQTWANVEILKILPNTVFWPQPKVDSAIVGITPRFDRLERIDDTDLFRTIAQGLFSARRKKAVNALKQDERVMVPAETLKRGFEIAAIDPDRRGEDLSVDEVISLANAIEEARQTIEAPTG